SLSRTASSFSPSRYTRHAYFIFSLRGPLPPGHASRGPLRPAPLREVRAPIREFRNAAGEKTPLRLLTRQRERALVRVARIGGPSEPAAEVRARGVREPILAKIPVAENPIDHPEAGGGAI